MIASGSDEGRIIVHNVANGAVLKVIDTESSINSISFSRDGSKLAVGSDDNKCRVYDTLIWEY